METEDDNKFKLIGINKVHLTYSYYYDKSKILIINAKILYNLYRMHELCKIEENILGEIVENCEGNNLSSRNTITYYELHSFGKSAVEKTDLIHRKTFFILH